MPRRQGLRGILSAAAAPLNMGAQAVFLRLVVEKDADVAEIPALRPIVKTTAASQPEDLLDRNAIAHSADPGVMRCLGK